MADLTRRAPAVTAAAGDFRVTVAGTAAFWMGVETVPVAAGFLCTAPAPVLTCRVTADLPLRLTTSWRRAGRG